MFSVLIVTAIVVFIYSCMLFSLVSVISEKRRFSNLIRIVFSSVNAVGFCFYIQNTDRILMFHYILLIAIFLVESAILFKCHFFGLNTMILGTLLHLFVLRSLVASILSMINEVSPAVYLYNHANLWVTTVIAFAINIGTMIVFIKLFSKAYIMIISDNREFINGVYFLTLLVTIYMCFNSHIFYTSFDTDIAFQQMLIAITMITVFYISLAQIVRIINLHGYKSKTEELEDKINKDRVFKYALFNLADIVCEINCSANEVQRLLFNGNEINIENHRDFSKQLEWLKLKYISPKDINEIEKISSSRIIKEFEKGNTDITLDFRSLKIIFKEEAPYFEIDPKEYTWYRIRSKSDIADVTGELMAVFTIDEIQDEKEKELSLKKKAETDPITGSLNKEGAQSRIDQHLSLNGIGSLFMFDLDNFKGINDTFGHSYGDFVLCDVYKNISELFRPYDIVSRIGGDEFIVFMIGTIDKRVITRKAEAMCSLISKAYVGEGGTEVSVSGSIGVAISPQDGNGYTELFNAADLAMYHSKNHGKNSFTFYSENLNKPLPKQY